MRIIVDQPLGMWPRLQPEELKPNAATYALNCRIGDGYLQPYRAPLTVPSATDAANAAVSSAVPIETIYRVKDDYGDTWMSWATDVDVVRGQIPNDRFRRIYWSGDGAPKMADSRLIRPTQGDVPPYPKSSYPLGVAEPSTDLELGDIELIRYQVALAYDGDNEAVFTHNDSFAWQVRPFVGGDTVTIGANSELKGTILEISDNTFKIVKADNTAYTQTDITAVAPVTGAQVVILGVSEASVRYYAYSFVSIYGERGPLKLFDRPINTEPGGNITNLLLSFDTLIPTNVNKVQLWRTLGNGTSSSDFHLVNTWFVNGIRLPAEYEEQEYDNAPTLGAFWLLADSRSDLSMANAEVAGNAAYDPPLPDSHSILALTNKVTVMASGNMLQFSVPGQPHAYPAAWHEPMPEDIVGLSYVGTTVIVITRDDAYLAHAADPANVVVERLYAGNGGVSKRSIVTVPGFGCLYASKVGMHMAGLDGVRNITRDYINAEQWEAMMPETLEAAFWENKLIGWFDQTAPTPGMIFDFQRPDTGLMWVGERLRALYVDPETDELYGVQNRTVVEWDASETRLTGAWTSKRFDIDDDSVFGFAEIEAETFNNTTFTLSAGREPNMYVVDSYQVTSDEPERIACRRDDKFQLALLTTDKVRRGKVAETAAEL